MNVCIFCRKPIAKYATKYCSNQCQSDNNYKNYIEKWKLGVVSGARGVEVKNISSHISRYILDKFDNRCAECGWDMVNPAIGKVILEIDHIDGNSDNNREENLTLLCPNCHSLTSNYKNLNKGNGRAWRREKYVKIV